LAVVDPGVGTPRRALIVEKAGHLFVGPDNGIFSFLYPADSVVNVTWRPHGAIAPSFHGRDLFAPIAIRLLTGTTPLELGHAMNDPVSLDITSPQVVHIDRYGNIVTNITPGQLQGHALVLQGRIIQNRVNTFEDLHQDAIGLIVGSAGTIEIVARQKHAADMLGAAVGMPLVLNQGP
ncbi:MAG TPA: SAM-dependent chlorinase/fluorinase, partial [Deltaproteobacteria bacterium]|nr:SAM-dependent chlorinase/fluorinase [Deltaproteobacteria bacterium]